MFRRNFISYVSSSSSSCSLFRATLPLLESSTGMVRQWKEGSRFGFITDDDSSDSLFVHRSNCIWADDHETHRSIAGGTRVAYDIVFDTRKGDGRKRCENVTLDDGSPLPAGPYRDLDAGSASSSSSSEISLFSKVFGREAINAERTSNKKDDRVKAVACSFMRCLKGED